MQLISKCNLFENEYVYNKIRPMDGISIGLIFMHNLAQVLFYFLTGC